MQEEAGSREAVRADAGLQRRLESLSRAQALARLGSFDWDICTGVLYFSEQMYRLCGIPPGEHLDYRRYLELIHPDDRRAAAKAVRAALAGAPYAVDHRIVSRDGELRTFHCDGEVVFEDGKPVRMFGTALDVTERRRSLEHLEARERLFRLLVENAHDVIFRYRLRPEPSFEYVSPSVARITGFTAADLYEDPQNIFTRVHPDDREQVERNLSDPASNIRSVIRVRHADGSWRWAEQIIAPVYDESGELLAIEGIARDVTEAKRAEEEREELVAQLDSERRWLDTVIEELPVGVILLTRRSRRWHVSANGAAERLLGRKLDPDRGVEQAEGWILRADGTPLPVEEVPGARAMRGELVPPLEYRLRRPVGDEVPVLGSAAPIRDPSGRVLGAMAVWEDLTNVKDLERLREEWTSIVAHDLRQPVTVINAYAGLLARQLEKPETKAKACHIMDAARRLNRLIEDLLDVSRIEAHRVALEKVPVDLRKWIEAVLERASADHAANPIRLEFGGGPVPEAVVDPVRLEQVLGNLLSNAVKYGYAARPITVQVECTSEWARISVCNYGSPIPPEELTKLFGRFHRAPPANGEKVSGLGLGLYICKGLVEAHGGRIWAESDPAGINTFRFEVPIQPR